MAPGAHVVVLRDIPAGTLAARLRTVRSRVRLPLQLVLRRRGRPVPAVGPGPRVQARDRGGGRLPPACRRRHGRTPRPGSGPSHGRAGRARHPARATAPGTADHGHQARAVEEPGGARLRADRVSGPRRYHAFLVVVAPGRDRAHRSRRRRIRVRQRVPPPPDPSRAVRPGGPPRDRWRVARVHRRRGLPPPRVLAVRRLGRSRGWRLARPALLVG